MKTCSPEMFKNHGENTCEHACACVLKDVAEVGGRGEQGHSPHAGSSRTPSGLSGASAKRGGPGSPGTGLRLGQDVTLSSTRESPPIMKRVEVLLTLPRVSAGKSTARLAPGGKCHVPWVRQVEK